MAAAVILFKMAAAAVLVNFEWPYLRNGSRSTYIARIARSSLRQHSSLVNLQLDNIFKTAAFVTYTKLTSSVNFVSHYLSAKFGLDQ